ncbi:MAG: ABC transporter substrate-binding protein, partial [Candidatus Cryptobacteroides sp.]
MPFLLSCSSGNEAPVFEKMLYRPSYAGGFSILCSDSLSSTILRVRSAWQGADSSALDLFISRDGELPPEGFKGRVVKAPVRKLAVMSTSHIAFLDCIGRADCIVAVSGLNLVNSPAIIGRRNEIAEIGYDSNADYEALVSSGVSLVLLYGVTSGSPMEEKLSALGIPYIYIGEYVETSPLGKAEWMVALGEILDCREEAFEAFCKVADNYNALSFLVADVEERPIVMLNAPYCDAWFLPSSKSVTAAFISDAGGSYPFSSGDSNRSVPVDFEQAFINVCNADFWLDATGFDSVESILDASPEFNAASCVRERRVFNPDARVNDAGGNDFWESGAARPDLVLSDLISILHPEI